MFLFPPETQYGVVGKLSGGERRRLQLLRVLIKNPNFLILDEPTNDLDLQTLNVLEDFLTGFPGCLMLVSHDRYFMDKLVDHSFIFHGGGKIEDFAGNYSDFRIKSAEKEHEKVKSIKKSTEKQVSKVEKPKHKLSYKEQLEYEKLEVEIDQLEEQKKTLIKAMNGGEMDHDTLVNAGIEINKIDQDIDDKTNRWLFLSQFL
jgi:ATP-binding cassette subfamily F protein uup